jgi:hypothetical protein
MLVVMAANPDMIFALLNRTVQHLECLGSKQKYPVLRLLAVLGFAFLHGHAANKLVAPVMICDETEMDKIALFNFSIESSFR